jgi:plastocyanin
MNQQALVWLCAALSAVALAACGDTEEQPTTTTSSGSVSSSGDASSSSSSSSSSGMGGAGGMGGMAASSSSSSSSSSSGMGGAGGMGGGGGTGGGGGGEPAINGCKPATADDYTGMATATVQFVGLSYSPACIRVKKGTMVTFEGMFGSHPLEGGTVMNGIPTPDPNSPITKTNTGMSATFTLSNEGVVPYYCTFHAASGMMGAIFVDP